MGRFRPKAFFLSHYSKSVYPKNTYPHLKKTLGLEDPLCWMAFPQWQPGLSSQQVTFALGLKRPTITLTLVQTRFECQGKFLNFYEVYEYFRKISLFLSHILIFHLKKFFVMNFHEVYEYFWKIFLFLSYWFFITEKNVYECSWSLWVFLKDFSFFESYINFSSLLAWRSVDPLKSWEFFVHVRNESTIWTIWIV